MSLRVIHVLFLICFISLINTEALGQEHFIVYGKLKTETGRLQNGQILVEKNGVKDHVLRVEGSGKFEFKLDFNAEYIISFSQEGYVSKKVSFSTTAPAERIEFGFDPFEFHVEIFKQYDDISTVVFNQPVGQIKFNPEYDDFDFDKDYSKSILRQMKEIEQQSKEKAEKEAEQKKKEEKSKPPKQKAKKEPPKAPEKSTPPPPIAKTESTPPPKATERTITPTQEKTMEENPYKSEIYSRSGNLVVLHAYTVGEYNYPNLPAYGYINFGDGAGNREISKEEFKEYARKYR